VIVREGAAFIIKNGDGKRVIVNGQPVLSRKELRSGDRVSVAGVLLEFSLQDRAR
jgi:RNase P/RNase MRP subunit p29